MQETGTGGSGIRVEEPDRVVEEVGRYDSQEDGEGLCGECAWKTTKG